ncbi:MAG: Nicotinamide-nucleotide amidohydrolase PncC [uncultured marine phage]|uniref:Nicotinamide-nucleotide amidohydrolase PncC n=1 Tax=uncultured marine phage TaxID=707152 RepID=A0A8D9FR88_9VIRU|nr:MAG: Nicotinamide-nucleotide amidohydrolase PncC [uncultured marine phage]
MDKSEENIKYLCDKLGLKVSVSESLTGGKIQDRLVSVSGSSSYFQGGVTVYNIDQKVNLLGIDREHAESVNCISERVAEEMAKGCNELFGSDISIGITGYAEPYGDIKDPFCYYSINFRGEILETDTFIGAPNKNFRNGNRTVFTSRLVHQLDQQLQSLEKTIERDNRLKNLLNK